MATCLDMKFNNNNKGQTIMPAVNLTKLISEAKTTDAKKELVRKYPAIFKDVFPEAKDDDSSVRLFPTIHYQDNSIDPPKAIQDLMEKIALAIQEELLDDFDSGMYNAVCELISSPLALVEATATKLLEQIIDSVMNQNMEALEAAMDKAIESDEKPTVCDLGKQGVVDTTPATDDDISDEEMLASLREPAKLQGE